MPADHSFTVFMYSNELKFLQWLVMEKPAIETGGDLFGLWQDKDTAVVQLILGPGQNCSRTTSSFHQDVQYLENAGQYLTSCEGLCNIGEWHSHHRIGLTKPSGGDKDTVWSNMHLVSGGRFLLFIAHIKDSNIGTSAEVRCFLFNNRTKKMSEGELKPFGSCSPLRHNLYDASDQRAVNFVKHGYEENQDWKTFRSEYLRLERQRGYGSCSAKATRNSVSGELVIAELGLPTASRCVCDIEDYPTADDHLRSACCCCCCCVRLGHLCRCLCRCLRCCVSACYHALIRLFRCSNVNESYDV